MGQETAQGAPAPAAVVPVFLIVQWYLTNVLERQHEIDACLQINLLNPHICEVYVMLESEAQAQETAHLRQRFDDPGCRLRIVTLGHRMSFSDAFICANDTASRAGCPSVALVANADIYFDATLQWLTHGFLPSTTALALLRHGAPSC
jgi:hypothetical protein